VSFFFCPFVQPSRCWIELIEFDSEQKLLDVDRMEWEMLNDSYRENDSRVDQQLKVVEIMRQQWFLGNWTRSWFSNYRFNFKKLWPHQLHNKNRLSKISWAGQTRVIASNRSTALYSKKFINLRVLPKTWAHWLPPEFLLKLSAGFLVVMGSQTPCNESKQVTLVEHVQKCCPGWN